MSKPKSYPNLESLLKLERLVDDVRPYKVKHGRSVAYVVTNSPLQAAHAVCDVTRVEKDELLQAFSQLMVPPQEPETVPTQPAE